MAVSRGCIYWAATLARMPLPQLAPRGYNSWFTSTPIRNARPAWKKNSSIGLRPFSSGPSNSETLFDYATKQSLASDIEARMAEPGFWDNQEKAQATIAELKSLGSILKPLEEAIAGAADLQTLMEMATEDESMVGELTDEIARLEKRIGELELKGLLSGPYDAKGAIVTCGVTIGPRERR